MCIHGKSIMFFSVYLFLTSSIIIIFTAFINTQKSCQILTVHPWGIHDCLFHLLNFHIHQHHHHLHNVINIQNWLYPDCASMANPRSSSASIYFLDTSSSLSSSSSSFSQHYKRLKVWSNPECACMGKSISSHELINNFDKKILWVYILSVLISVNLSPALHVQHFF